MLYGSKLREIHVVQLMLSELLGPKPPATVTILSLFLKGKGKFSLLLRNKPEKTWNSKSGNCFRYYLPYGRHYNPLMIRNRSWILTIHKARILRKKLLKKSVFDIQKVGWKNANQRL